MDPMAEAYREKKKWEEAMGIGTMDKLYDIVQGKKPDYNELDYLGMPKPEDQHLGVDEMFNVISGSSEEFVKTAQAIKEATPNQLKAISKYPSLIEMLGNDDSDELAEIVGFSINKYITSKIHGNSSSINKNAIECKQDGNCIKEYYKYSDRVGFVKVSGSFSGNEYIHYDINKNKAFVLKKKADKKFENLSNEYAIDMEFVKI
ncbi:MAG: hypothetical protein WC755_01935 [Candidatus Woesearchaeota archaeon]|jgi:hypothetical protein